MKGAAKILDIRPHVRHVILNNQDTIEELPDREVLEVEFTLKNGHVITQRIIISNKLTDEDIELVLRSNLEQLNGVEENGQGAKKGDVYAL